MSSITTADGIERTVTRREGRIIWCSPEHREVPSISVQNRIARDVSGFPYGGAGYEDEGHGGADLLTMDHGDAICAEHDRMDRNKARWEAQQKAKAAEKAELLRLARNNARAAVRRAAKPVVAPVYTGRNVQPVMA